MKAVRIGFSNMWGGHDDDFTDEYFYKLFHFLRDEYRVQVVDNPDFMFYSVYGYIKKPAPYATRILISGECGDHFKEGGKMSPTYTDPNFFHYGLTCAWDNTHPNHIFLPQPLIHLNLYNDGWRSLIRDGTPPPGKKYFCNFIYGNPYSPDRIEFCKKLMEYKRVECAGPVLNNTNVLRGLPAYDGAGYRAKQHFQSQCKFSIAFENNYFPGYTSEKLSDPLVARSVPIYFGNPKVDYIFNPSSFIDVRGFDNFEEAIDYVKEIDQDDERYEQMISAPPFPSNRIPDRFSDAAYLTFFRRVFG